jgi:hypothetical protein
MRLAGFAGAALARRVVLDAMAPGTGAIRT